jgi:NADH dehydrogenase FAD-containing subunit/uncharacterized membrane protein YphA (DoxX/SURF4 family)
MNGPQAIEFLTAALRRGRTSLRFAASVARWWIWPKGDLTIRLWLAQLFLLSGMLKLKSWQSALELAAYEYPVSFMSPLHAAYLGVTIEVLGGVLIALGFMTRYAAVPLLILSLVIQFAYQPLDSQLFWVALFGWYAIIGAGPISIDALLRRGLAESALPVVSGMARAGNWLRTAGGPVYLSLIRIWLGAACCLVTWPAPLSSSAVWPDPRLWLPVATLARVPVNFAEVLGFLLLTGLGTRLVSAALIVTMLADAMMDSRQTGVAYAIMVFAILTLFGAGSISLDAGIAAMLRRFIPERENRDPQALEGLPKVVIVGAGFGGIRCALKLRHAGAVITLIDRTNYHLFQPLLYQVATAGLSPGDIATPVRQIFRDTFGVRVLFGSVTAIDATRQCVVADGNRIDYDYLVVATGATHSYFGKEEWAPFAPGLKHLEDAVDIRRRLLTAFERAEFIHDREDRATWLTFLVVGGGPTGVELAGAIAELARFGLNQDFRTFDPAQARVILVQSASRLLPTFPEKLSQVALLSLERLGVEVRLGSRVEHIDGAGVIIDGQRISARTVLWAAGVKASPAAEWLGVPADAAGRIKVDAMLRVPGLQNVFAIGDTAASQRKRKRNTWPRTCREASRRTRGESHSCRDRGSRATARLSLSSPR